MKKWILITGFLLPSVTYGALFNLTLASKIGQFNRNLSEAEVQLKESFSNQELGKLVFFRHYFSKAVAYLPTVEKHWSKMNDQEHVAVSIQIRSIAPYMNKLGNGSVLTIYGSKAESFFNLVDEINRLSTFAAAKEITHSLLRWRVVSTTRGDVSDQAPGLLGHYPVIMMNSVSITAIKPNPSTIPTDEKVGSALASR